MDAAHLARINGLARAAYWLLILWIPFAITAGMVFDHSKSGGWNWSWLYLKLILILPIAVLVAPPLARHHLSWGRVKIAYITAVVPYLLYFFLCWPVLWMILGRHGASLNSPLEPEMALALPYAFSYVLFIFCWFVPPFLIFRSHAVAGWNKTLWVMGCFISAMLPPLLVAIAFTVRLADHQRDTKALMFGQDALMASIANTLSLVLPWVVYLAFKKRNAGRH
jgi:hypothetical protein